jgi:hypothetical protein
MNQDLQNQARATWLLLEQPRAQYDVIQNSRAHSCSFTLGLEELLINDQQGEQNTGD